MLGRTRTVMLGLESAFVFVEYDVVMSGLTDVA
jgi:hypothetical protein